jgi:hypothetical protein
MEQRIIYVGLDVHKDTIAVALAEAGKRGDVREHGKIANTPAALRTLAAKLASHGWRLPHLQMSPRSDIDARQQLDALERLITAQAIENSQSKQSSTRRIRPQGNSLSTRHRHFGGASSRSGCLSSDPTQIFDWRDAP